MCNNLQEVISVKFGIKENQYIFNVTVLTGKVDAHLSLSTHILTATINAVPLWRSQMKVRIHFLHPVS